MRYLFKLFYRFPALALLALLASCSATQSWSYEDPRALNAGDVKMLNYTPWYIHTASIQGPEGSGVHGGGPNVMPIQENGHTSGGGKATCCMTYREVWQPDLRLTVRWLADKKQDGKTPGYWYKAENVRIAPYETEDSRRVADISAR